MRSFATAALCLSLIHTSSARVPHSFRDLAQRDTQPEPQPEEGVFRWLSKLLRRELKPRQEGETCYEDDYYTFVGSDSLGEDFCQDYMGYPNRTVPVQATATSTLTTIYTTDIDTVIEYEREQSTNTVTETVTAGAAKAKRNGEAMITPRAALGANDAFAMFRRQAAATEDDDAMRSSFSSACSCHDYEGQVVTETYTGRTTVRTISAFANSVTTETITQTAGAAVVTTTTTVGGPTSSASEEVSTTEAPAGSSGGSSAQLPTTTVPGTGSSPVAEGSTTGAPDGPSEGPSGYDSPTVPSTTMDATPGNPTPTAPAFTCPDDDNTTVSQMVGNERFDYLVLCDTVLMDSDVYSGVLTYASFSECVGACSVANQQFDAPVCQGVSFYETDSSGAGNCFLKRTANNTVMAEGVDSALLQSVELGMSDDNPEGSATESAPFAGAEQTADPSGFSSAMSSVLSDSTEAMPMVTPVSPAQSGRQVADITAYSTYVSDGSTFSSGTGYTSATTFANGSWVSYYYTSYTQTWASETTVYGATETGNVYENSTSSSSQQTNGENGEYGIITTTNYGHQNGSSEQVVRTISYEADGTPFFSTATTYYTEATGAAGGGAGGAAGGSAGSPASTPAGPLVTSTPVPNNGSSSGEGASGAVGGPGSGGPSSDSTVLILTTQTVTGQPGNTGFEESGFGAGGPPVTQTFVSTIVNNGTTAYSTYYVISGGPSSTPSGTILTVISTAGATGGESGGMGAGGPGATGGASSGILSGRPSSSPSSSPSGSLSIVTIISSGGATGGGTGGAGAGGPGATGVVSSLIASGGPSSSSPLTASFTDGPRSGSYSNGPSGSAPSGFAPSGSGPSGFAPSGYAPSGSAPFGSAPIGTSPTASFTDASRSGTLSLSASAPIFVPPSGGVYSYSPPGTLPSPIGTGTSPLTFSDTDVPRSGTLGSSTPVGTAPVSSSPADEGEGGFSAYDIPPRPRTSRSRAIIRPEPTEIPEDTPPEELPTPFPSGTAPSGTLPSGTAPLNATSPLTFTNSERPRSGTYSSDPSASGASGSPPGTSFVPTGTTASSGFPAASGSLSGFAPSGSGPSAGFPAPSGSAPASPEESEEGGFSAYDIPPRPSTRRPSSGFPDPSGSAPSSGFPALTGSAPSSALIPTGTSPLTFSNTDAPRGQGSGSSAMPSMTFPAQQSACLNGTMGTTTIVSTTTVFGCYSSCAPAFAGGYGGGYGGPGGFGPPAPTEVPEDDGGDGI